MPDWIQVETRGGEPMKLGEATLTPFSKSFTIRLPGRRGGLVWNRPVSVLMQTPGGGEEILPVQDVTRQIQWSLLGASLGFGFLVWLFSRRFRKS